MIEIYLNTRNNELVLYNIQTHEIETIRAKYRTSPRISLLFNLFYVRIGEF